MLLTQTPKLEDVPSFLVGIAGELQIIKDALFNPATNKSNSTEAEKPTNVFGAADHVNLDQQTVYRLVRANKIPYHKRGKKLYFFRSELNTWLKAGGSNVLIEETDRKFYAVQKNKKGQV